MIVKDSRKSGSPLATEGIGTHCPGSEHKVNDKFGEKLVATSPIFVEIKKREGGKKT